MTLPASNLRARHGGLLLGLGLGVSGCAGHALHTETAMDPLEPLRVTRHAGGDDLLTAGLGEAGLRAATPPAFADPLAPTPAELRRRAIWSNWRGIADLAPGGGYGEFYGGFGAVSGTEYQTLATLPGARQPHRVLVQVPDGFDREARCLVVAASSGSRGIYGAIALAGAWGLPRGCAVVYTDKGAGTDYVDLATGQGPGIDGTLAGGDARAFAPTGAAAAGVAVKHAHSQDNPEADWGRHVRQAADIALQVLDRAFPAQAPHTPASVRTIAVGVSNGGGAVLRAAEEEGAWLDGVVAISPNVWPGDGGRPLYDYVTEAALLMPCALAAPAFADAPYAREEGAVTAASVARCASLAGRGTLSGADLHAQAAQAHARLRATGWSDAAIAAGALSSAFDLWRSVAATYASAYARAPAGAMPCGFRFDMTPPASTAADATRAAWWADASGIPPGAGVGLVEAPPPQGGDPALPGLLCLRALWTGDDPAAAAVRHGVAATRAALPRADLPVILVHGSDDGLIPEAFAGGAYARWAQANGRPLSYWRVDHAQHFDAFLGVPALGARYVPLMPYAYRALDAMWAHLSAGAALPGNAHLTPLPRGSIGGAPPPLTAEALRLPR